MVISHNAMSICLKEEKNGVNERALIELVASYISLYSRPIRLLMSRNCESTSPVSPHCYFYENMSLVTLICNNVAYIVQGLSILS